MRTLIVSFAILGSLVAPARAGEFLVFPSKLEDGKLTFRHFSKTELFGKRDVSTQESMLALAADVKILEAKLTSIEGANTEVIGPYKADIKLLAMTVAVRSKLAEKRAIEDMTGFVPVAVPMAVVLVTEGDTVKEIRVIQNLTELLQRNK